ncbi:MAG: hypothetical protein ACXAC2_15950 [Candidatus Kariarchaeaceae archaeon]|jgi:hypothetical protein
MTGMAIWDEGPTFWDIMGPLLLVIFILLIFGSIFCIINKQNLALIGIAFIQYSISFVFLFSIGIILAIFPTLNVIFSIIISISPNKNSVV